MGMLKVTSKLICTLPLMVKNYYCFKPRHIFKFTNALHNFQMRFSITKDIIFFFLYLNRNVPYYFVCCNFYSVMNMTIVLLFAVVICQIFQYYLLIMSFARISFNNPHILLEIFRQQKKESHCNKKIRDKIICLNIIKYGDVIMMCTQTKTALSYF